MNKTEIMTKAETFRNKIKNDSIKEIFDEKIEKWVEELIEVQKGEKQGLYPDMKIPFTIVSDGMTARLYNHIFDN